MTFRSKEWVRKGNHYTLVGTQIMVYQWNTGKNAKFLVEAGFKNSNHIEKYFEKGPEARDAAINFALSIRDKYPRKHDHPLF